MSSGLIPENPRNPEMIPLLVPEIRGNEWQYVRECLDTGWVSSVGAYVDRFEQAVARRARRSFGVATMNGTSALHIALVTAGIRADEEVLVSSLTFIAPANAIRYVGAWPVFIDAEPRYWQMDPAAISRFFERDCRLRDGGLYNVRTGRRIAAILPAHILGHPVDLDPILEIARKYGLVVIEDVAEGLGASYKENPVGKHGDIACFSFNGNKIVTTGGGGVLVTDNEQWARKARYLTTQAKDDPIEYIHNEIGYNYRLTNLLAALGCAQMELLDDYVESKRRMAARYSESFVGLAGITPMSEAFWATSTFWMYTILVDESILGFGSRDLLRALAARNIQCRPLWQPIHLSPAHRSSSPVSLPVAEKLYRQGLCIPCSVGLSVAQQGRVIGEIQAIATSRVLTAPAPYENELRTTR